MSSASRNGVQEEVTFSAFNLQTCARPNVLTLKPYRCAREYFPARDTRVIYSDYSSGILLDANENAYGPSLPQSLIESSQESYLSGLNRYPDPHQLALKQLVCSLRNTQSQPKGLLTPANLFCGVGSDEAIDSVIRVFCKPGRDKILICTPSYGVYNVSAAVNEVEIVDVPLLRPTWQIDTYKVSL
jgi:histidinol-phosphate aminotransferase